MIFKSSKKAARSLLVLEAKELKNYSIISVSKYHQEWLQIHALNKLIMKMSGIIIKRWEDWGHTPPHNCTEEDGGKPPQPPHITPSVNPTSVIQIFWSGSPSGSEKPPDLSKISIRRNFRKHCNSILTSIISRSYIEEISIRRIQLLIRNNVSLIQRKNFGLLDYWHITPS